MIDRRQFACLSVLLVGCSTKVDSAESDVALRENSQEIIAAPLDPDHTFSVGICHQNGEGSCSVDGSNCSGTLVAPNLVLTARHCVDRCRQIAPSTCDVTFCGTIEPDQLVVTTSAAPYAEGATPTWIKTSKVLVPSDARLCDSDIALLILEDSVPSTEATPVWVDVETDLALTLPSEAAIVARGWVEAKLVFDNGAIYPEVVDHGGLQRRYLEHAPILCASNVDGGCSVEDITETGGTFAPTAGSVIVKAPSAPGDSGSGILEQQSFTAGAPQLIAVLNLGMYDMAHAQTAAGVRVSRHKDFLVDGALQAATLAGIEPPGWATGKPPPQGMPPVEPPKEEAEEEEEAPQPADDPPQNSTPPEDEKGDASSCTVSPTGNNSHTSDWWLACVVLGLASRLGAQLRRR